MTPPPEPSTSWTIVLSGLVGAIVGAVAALTSQFLAHRLADKRERKRFQVQAFERFRKEFTEDENLRRISMKKRAADGRRDR
jgi:hypothetical protein